MRKFTKGGLVAAAGLLCCAAGAQAADLPLRTAPPVYTTPVVANNWEGFYVGSTFGYNFTNFHTRQVTSRSISTSGQSGGGLVGYNFQYGRFVFGPEGSIDLNLVRRDELGQAGLAASHLDSLYDIRLRGRLGYAFGDFLPFVAGGAVINETYQSTVAPNNYFGSVKREVGYTVGAGIDYKINPSRFLPFQNTFLNGFLGPMVLRLEYLHDDVPTSTFAFNGGTFRTRSDTNAVRASIISRFGDNAPRPYADAAGNVNWAGGYGGLLGGGASLKTHTRLASGGPKNVFDVTGGIGGLYAGTNFIFRDHYMLGFDGSTAFTDITGSGSEPASERVKFRQYVQADIRARAGYAFGRFLPFVAAGVAFGRSEQTDTNTGSERGRVNSEALTFGAGLDYRLTERVSLRGEYLYEDTLNKKIVNLNGCNCKQELDGSIFRLGAAYHFE